MVEHIQDRMALAVRWAYALAATGRYANFGMVQSAVVAEGFPEAPASLDRPGIREAIATICATSRKGKPKR
jgi:hypothetical protein